MVHRQYRCGDGFMPAKEPVEQPFNGILYEEPGLKVTAAILDHGIPCLGLAIKEDFHVNIITEGLKDLGLEPGPWLADFKRALYHRSDPDTKFELRSGRPEKTRHYRLGELTDKIARITPGQKISYITDVVGNQSNSERIVALVKGSDHLYIEAAFLDTHKEIAAQKNHLTARQAGHLSALARVKQFTVFHFSPRYTGQAPLLQEEARQAYDRQMTADRSQGSENRGFLNSEEGKRNFCVSIKGKMAT
jgi:ribonuclease Z